MIRKTFLPSVTTLALAFGTTAALAAPIETYLGVAAKSPAGVVSAIDSFFATDDAKGYEVYLVASVFDGDDPATHFVVADYDSYEAYDKLVAKRPGSLAWANTMASFMSSADPVRDGMGVIRASYGEGWPERDNYVMVISIDVTDRSAYGKAFTKLAESEVGKQAPGITRLIENRSAGNASTHYVVMSAPTFASLNEHLDRLFTSDAYEDFNDDVKNIRTIVGSASYRKIKTWSK
ncbi:MAG: hypothetical protein QNJ73_08000 [Gammaproteobacteria bacterium]|nr:hypothetical protein [Gammaproteobacteria bacterium]